MVNPTPDGHVRSFYAFGWFGPSPPRDADLWHTVPMGPTFMKVVDELVERGVNGITSYRQLAERMAELGDANSETYRREFSRYRQGANPREKTILLAVRAFDVPRSKFPAAAQTRLRLRELAELLELVAQAQVEQEDLLVSHDARLRALEALLPQREVSGEDWSRLLGKRP